MSRIQMPRMFMLCCRLIAGFLSAVFDGSVAARFIVFYSVLHAFVRGMNLMKLEWCVCRVSPKSEVREKSRKTLFA